MAQVQQSLKERVRSFWQAHPCGTKFADAEEGSRAFFEAVEEHRYRTEWHIPEAAGFDSAAPHRRRRQADRRAGHGDDDDA